MSTTYDIADPTFNLQGVPNVNADFDKVIKILNALSGHHNEPSNL